MWYPVITLSDEVSLLSCSADNGWEAPDIRCLWYGYNYVYLFLEHEELNDNPRTVPGLQSKFSSSSWVMIETPNHPLGFTQSFAQNRYYNLGAVTWVQLHQILSFQPTAWVHSHQIVTSGSTFMVYLFFFLTASCFFDAYFTVALFAPKTNEVRSISQD